MTMEPGFRITELFAFTSVTNDVEGVCSVQTPAGHMPLIGADMDRVKSLRPVAQSIARQFRQPVYLRRFTAVPVTDSEPLEVIYP